MKINLDKQGKLCYAFSAKVISKYPKGRTFAATSKTRAVVQRVSSIGFSVRCILFSLLILMDNPKTTQAHNTSLTGAVDFQYRFTDGGVKEIVSAAFKVLSNQDQAREFVARFRQDNPDVHLSDAQWTKLIDALSA